MSRFHREPVNRAYLDPSELDALNRGAGTDRQIVAAGTREALSDYCAQQGVDPTELTRYQMGQIARSAFERNERVNPGNSLGPEAFDVDMVKDAVDLGR